MSQPSRRRATHRPGSPLPGHDPRPFRRWLLGLAVLSLGIGLLWAGAILAQEGVSIGSDRWPNTLGMVTECEEGVTTPATRDRPRNHIAYRYDVNDRKYTSSSFSFDADRAFDCADYPLGKGVRVYYAPWRPSIATLTPNDDSTGLRVQLVGALLCMVVGLGIGMLQIAILVRPNWMRQRV